MKEFLTKKITRGHLQAFLKRQATSKKVLNIGSGREGYNYKELFPNTTFIDINPERKPDVIGDAHALPFKDESFEVVVSTEVLEHLHSPEVAISEMRRVLKKGGRVILTTRFMFPIHGAPHDYFRFTKYGLMHLFRDWQILELVEEVNTQETIAVLLQRIGYQSDIRLNKISKVIIFLMAKMIMFLPNMITQEYGGIEKVNKEKNMMTSGYYLVSKK